MYLDFARVFMWSEYNLVFLNLLMHFFVSFNGFITIFVPSGTVFPLQVKFVFLIVLSAADNMMFVNWVIVNLIYVCDN